MVYIIWNMYIIYTGYWSENLSEKCLPITPLPSWVSKNNVVYYGFIYFLPSLLSLFWIKHWSWDSVNSLVSANLCYAIVTISHVAMFTRTLQGHTHQGLLGLQGLSSSFGTQSTAISFVALLFASFHTDPSTWGSHHLDTIVLGGNSLYRAIVCEQFNRNVTILLTHMTCHLI